MPVISWNMPNKLQTNRSNHETLLSKGRQSWTGLHQAILVSFYQKSISCFLIDIDPISKIPEICLNRSSSFSVPVFFKIVNIYCFQNVDIYKDHVFVMPQFFLFFSKCPCVSKDKHSWSWKVWTRSKISKS